MRNVVIKVLPVNKQGISSNMVMWIPRLVYLILVFVVSFGLIFSYTTTKVGVGDVESHILLHRLQLSPDGISKVDDATGRVYTGVVDPAKLSSENLQTVLGIGENSVAMRIESYPFATGENTTAYLHENTYENWQPIAVIVGENRPVKGSGLKFPYRETRYVYAGSPSRLETVVIMPNE
jgi:hypothetical protein